jgi:DNA polymerase I-like protein with 3'-5' exonuclease and polymerase domains
MALLDITKLNPALNVTVIKDWAGMQELLDWLSVTHDVGLDVETNPLKTFFARKCRLIQFGNKDRQWVIDLRYFVDSPEDLRDAQGDFGANLYKYTELHAVICSLRPFLESALWRKYGVNLWFEFSTLYWGFGLRPWNFFDCQLAERVIWAGEHSLKDFDFFSMDQMMLRYYGIEIDKSLQTSFDVDTDLTPEQYQYAALDTRFPFAIRSKQVIVGEKYGLLRTMDLENEAVGSFADMHVHGEKIDIPRWKKNTQAAADKRKIALDKLDEIFLPRVGSKHTVISDEEIESATAKWKALNEVSSLELEIKAKMKVAKKAQSPEYDVLQNRLTLLVEERKSSKDALKEVQRELSRKKAAIAKLAEKCPGEALVNYDSPAQVHKELVKITGLKTLASSNDNDLKQFEGRPVIDALRDYREWDKRVKTYGDSWTTEWTTHPCADEGWLSPYTHKLHSMTNQLLAETGRTSSDSPNAQNLPQDVEVRQCFVADDGFVYVIADMSGAELRIIAELANAKTWIEAFARGEDVHSVSTEILFPKEWAAETEAGCAYFKLNDKGEPQKQKCKCKGHKKRRDATKTLNFLLAYGGSAATLAARTGMTLAEAQHVCAVHQQKFPDIWNYLEKSGKLAKQTNESRDMFGRRRVLPAPTHERARKKRIEDYPESLEYPEALQEKNIAAFEAEHGRKPKAEEKFWLLHREPNQWEIKQAFFAINGSIERAGKNHAVQGTNASIAKVALGSGFDKNGKGFLFHVFPKYGAKLIKFIHDEIVVQCKPEVASQVADEISDAFKRAAAEVMTKVVMESEFKISNCWEK